MARIDDRTIARWRLHSQGLSGPQADDDAEVVRRLLGVQAENHDQATWAVATRTGAPERTRFERLFDEGEILRTHVLRPTWHFVARDDLRWLLDLTAPRIRPLYRRIQADHSVSDGDVGRAHELVERTLSDGAHRTRDELAERLAADGIHLSGPGLGVVLAHAELDGLICSGARRGRHHTYALLAERAAGEPRPDRDEALAELALRYFTGHGPATERDLAYWATLTLTDVRAGIHAVADRLQCFELDGRTYWWGGGTPAPAGDDQGHLLQILDELYRGYQDSRWVLDADGLLPRGRETSLGMAVVDGQVIGRMRRHVDGAAVRFELDPLRPWTEDERRSLDHAAARYGRFLGLPAAVIAGG